MKNRRIKKKPFIILIFITILIILLVLYIIKINSNEYKLGKIGYNKSEIKEIIKLDKNRINDILEMKYNKHIKEIVSQKYYMDKYFNDYLKYISKNPNLDYDEIVAIINVGSNKEFYTDTKKAKSDDGKLILVNKYNYLDENYKVKLKEVEATYAYDGVKLDEEAYENFVKMVKDCNAEGNHLIALDGYRSYDSQESQYNYYKYNKGIDIADKYAAKPGYSEHQTGLAIDVNIYPNPSDEDFNKFDEYKWLLKHAHEYGFILRYPKGKENITGYSYESWHFRYVGKDIAKKIKELNITFDEYYAYFIEK